jgi:hypothetical protein
LRSLEVAGEDLSEVILAINDVSWQIIQPDPRGICLVNWEELYDKKIIVCSARSAHKVVVLQPDSTVWTEAASFMIVTAPVVWVSHTSSGLRVVGPWAVLSVHLRF